MPKMVSKTVAVIQPKRGASAHVPAKQAKVKASAPIKAFAKTVGK